VGASSGDVHGVERDSLFLLLVLQGGRDMLPALQAALMNKQMLVKIAGRTNVTKVTSVTRGK